MKIPCTIQIGTDATDPTARDATVKIIDDVLAILRAKITDMVIVESDDDTAIVTGTIDIDNVIHLD